MVMTYPISVLGIYRSWGPWGQSGKDIMLLNIIVYTTSLAQQEHARETIYTQSHPAHIFKLGGGGGATGTLPAMAMPLTQKKWILDKQ